MVASEEFEPAARAQSKALGFDPAMIWVPHPIQNRSATELAEIAEQSIERILAACTRG
ncbi:MAG: hypothetical protein KDK91_17605 [Gammaproteobacteria bacterium]|nr:hypothetical protein [Gammaproteobacteria bacterium]